MYLAVPSRPARCRGDVRSHAGDQPTDNAGTDGNRGGVVSARKPWQPVKVIDPIVTPTSRHPLMRALDNDNAPQIGRRFVHRMASLIWEMGHPHLVVRRADDGSVRVIATRWHDSLRQQTIAVDLNPGDVADLILALAGVAS